jgi:hypothetical protein
MDLKEKQIMKFNEANDLYHEVETMRAKLDLANLPESKLKQINEILALTFQADSPFVMENIQEQEGEEEVKEIDTK